MKKKENRSEIYRAIHKNFTKKEIKQINNIKRFFECIKGNVKFRKDFENEIEKREEILKSVEIINIDPNQMAIILPIEIYNEKYKKNTFENYPQAKLWIEYKEKVNNICNAYESHLTTSETYNIWRQRQINRCKSEFIAGPHILAAFELSKGCSMGCHFCGVSAESFKENFMYNTDNEKLWKDILMIFCNHFGKYNTGICYWATDPCDNPDYVKFILDYKNTWGTLPQTTTAAPLKNLDWTHEILSLRKKFPYDNVDRFSILSERILKNVHESFTADELSHIHMNIMTKSSIKTKAGRNLSKKNDTQEAGSIACVSGYLINMVERSIKLVSPCKASIKWPNGYIVFEENFFSNASDVNEFIVNSIKNHMKNKFEMDDILSFREDLEYIPIPNDGFHLKNSLYSHKMVGELNYFEIGSKINQKNMTLRELLSSSINIISTLKIIQTLYDKGLLINF